MTAVVVMGVSGSGKTSIGTLVAETLAVAFVDADELHPPANVKKMAGGTALTDDDRWAWLRLVAGAMQQRTSAGTEVVVACSALRRAYRDVLRTGSDDVRFVLLDVPRPDLEERLTRRRGHFMPAALLNSQLATLEPFSDGDPGGVVDASGSIEQTVDAVLAAVRGEGR